MSFCLRQIHYLASPLLLHTMESVLAWRTMSGSYNANCAFEQSPKQVACSPEGHNVIYVASVELGPTHVCSVLQEYILASQYFSSFSFCFVYSFRYHYRKDVIRLQSPPHWKLWVLFVFTVKHSLPVRQSFALRISTRLSLDMMDRKTDEILLANVWITLGETNWRQPTARRNTDSNYLQLQERFTEMSDGHMGSITTRIRHM